MKNLIDFDLEIAFICEINHSSPSRLTCFCSLSHTMILTAGLLTPLLTRRDHAQVSCLDQEDFRMMPGIGRLEQNSAGGRTTFHLQ